MKQVKNNILSNVDSLKGKQVLNIIGQTLANNLYYGQKNERKQIQEKHPLYMSQS